jgi:hypothetical protein
VGGKLNGRYAPLCRYISVPVPLVATIKKIATKMPLRSLLAAILLAFICCVAEAQKANYTINSISIPDGGTTFQGAPASSMVNFTEGTGFVDSVSEFATGRIFLLFVCKWFVDFLFFYLGRSILVATSYLLGRKAHHPQLLTSYVRATSP